MCSYSHHDFNAFSDILKLGMELDLITNFKLHLTKERDENTNKHTRICFPPLLITVLEKEQY